MTVIEEIKALVRNQFEADASGHDWYHIERVYKLAIHLQSKEGGDLEVIELAALLHDISDYKLNGGIYDDGGNQARKILSNYPIDSEKIELICSIIDDVSYKGAKVADKMTTIEGKIVQDADRLDAIGALGIARTFAYGGHKGQPMYDPELKPQLHEDFNTYANSRTSTINHFYEKLLLLRDRLNTETAKEIGNQRHQLMEDYLASFYAEWNIEI